MNEIRVPGARPVTRGKSSKGGITHEDSWDERFWLSQIPDYSKSLTDKVDSRPHSRSKQSLRLPILGSLRRTSRDRPRSHNQTRSVNYPPRRRELNEEQLNLLKTELEETWTSFDIPAFHREAFTQHIGKLASAEVVRAIVQEVNSLQKQDAPIMQVLKAIATRETLISQLKLFQHDEDSLHSRLQITQQYEAADMLHKYRQASIEVVEKITEWKRRLGDSELKFTWEGLNYLKKMKHDTAFMKQSDLSKVFNFPLEHDTFLTFASAPLKKVGLRSKGRVMKVNLPLSSVMLNRLKKAEIQLKMESTPREDKSQFSSDYEHVMRAPREIFPESDPGLASIAPIRKLSRRSSKGKTRESPQSITSIQETPAQTSPMKKAKLEVEQILAIAGLLAAEFIEEVVEIQVPIYTRDSSLEVIIAALILYSNNILDRIIVEALNGLIPEVAREAWNEETDIEYIDFQVQIIERAIDIEMKHGANAWVMEVLSEEIKSDWVMDVFFEDIVKEAIEEEHAWNGEIIVEVYTAMVNEIMDEEWVELLAESELEEALLDSKRNEMDPALQRELYNREKSFFIGKIAESMWFDWLNLIIADTWMPRLVESCVNFEELTDEQLFAYFDPVIRTSSKRLTIMR